METTPRGTTGGQARTLDIGSAGEGTEYGAREPIALSGIDATLAQWVRERAEATGGATLVADRQACGAAELICQGLPEAGPPGSDAVELALRSWGMIEPAPRLLVLDLPAGEPLADLGALQPQLDAALNRSTYHRLGVATCASGKGGGRTRAVIALFESRARVRRLARTLVVGQLRNVTFEVDPAWRDPQLVVSDPSGNVRRVPLRALAAGTWRGTVRCGERGIYRVELMAVADLGPEVLANFPLYCEMQPPQRAAISSTDEELSTASDDELALRLFQRSNAVRRDRGLPPLRSNADLSAIASAHSADMLDHGFVGHESPSQGGPVRRLRRRGIAFRVVRENVARGYGVEEVLRQLLNSPAHRASLLATDVTDLGVGVAVDRRQHPPVLFVTQLFASFSRSRTEN